jgi:uncharacterized protein YndB with AHSA1/START domain
MMADMSTPNGAPQVYPIFIKAAPDTIWAAITRPEYSQMYFYGARIENTPERHTAQAPDGSDWGDGPMFEFDPPRRLIYAWKSGYDPTMAAEPASRVTWQIDPQEGGYSLLTVTHDQLEASPRTAESVAGVGWMMVLSGLKTVLETGKSLSG